MDQDKKGKIAQVFPLRLEKGVIKNERDLSAL